MLNMQSEIWKDITGFEGMYQVSDLGGVKTLGRTYLHQGIRQGWWKEGLLTGKSNGKGYMHVVLRREGRSYRFAVHRLVMAAFVGAPCQGVEVDHTNGIKEDNRLCNLRYCTRIDNMRAGNHIRKNKSSRYVGVRWHKASGRWQSSVTDRGRQFYIGLFSTEDEAHQAYTKKVASLM